MNRWLLARAGILNVYQYENEILDFGGGRLLLRGINGSGKSTAMNMLLPFLLTGRTRGIDAAGEQTGVLKSWMLSGREEAQPVGYLWVEFERNGAAGERGDVPRHLVIGCGIKANRASETVTTWWFVTERRPGIDLQLIEHGIPLSAEGLRGAIDPDPVFAQDRRADYRREISRRLYGGADIEPWLSLLDTVRNPRVGDRIDRDLPEHLTGSLPVLSETALIEAARPLDDLDEHRRNVADLNKTASTLQHIGKVYRDYALTELHREWRAAKTVLKQADRRLREERQAIEAHEMSILAASTADERLRALKLSIRQLDETIRALQASSAYTDGLQLDDLRTAVADLARRLESVRTDEQSALSALQQDTEWVIQRQRQSAHDQEKLVADLANITSAVRQWSLSVAVPVMPVINTDPLVRSDLQIIAPIDALDGVAVETSLNTIAAAALTRRGDVDALQSLNSALAALLDQLQDARGQLQLVEQAVVDAEARVAEARTVLNDVCSRWDDAVSDWFDAVQGELASPLAAALSPGLQPRWQALADSEVRIERADRRDALSGFAEDWYDERREYQRGREAEEQSARAAVDDAREVLDTLLAQDTPVLPRPVWQRGEGVSFADAVDFKDTLDELSRAGIEAALQASGLLSATVSHDGLRLQSGELVVLPRESSDESRDGSYAGTAADAIRDTLADLLQPVVADDSPKDLTRENIARVLASISTRLDVGDTVIATDGSFRLGRLAGRHEKPLAEYVGIGARRAALERQRDAARTELDAANERYRLTERAREEAVSATQRSLALRQSLPSLAATDKADADLRAAVAHAERMQEQAQEHRETVAVLDRRCAEATDERDRQARTMQLPADSLALNDVARSLDELARDARDSLRSLGIAVRSVDDWREASDRWQASAQRLDDVRATLAREEAHHDGQRTRLDTLEATLGVAYREVVTRIDTHRHELNAAIASEPDAEAERDRCMTARVSAEAARGQAVNGRAAAEKECETSLAHWHALADVPGLIDIVALATTPDQADADIANTDDSPVDHPVKVDFAESCQALLIACTRDRAGLAIWLDGLEKTLPPLSTGDPVTADSVRLSMRARRDALGAGWDAENSQPNPTLPLALSVNGPMGRFSLADAVREVGVQLGQMQSLLSHKQDQALRNLLHGQLAGDIARKMHHAKTLIKRMNERLDSVTTSHGIGVRLRWRRDPELDEATGRMVDILEKLPDLRSVEEESTLREVLSARLDDARRLEPDAPYRQLIAAELDYRRWHDMKILLRRGDESERPLSRRTPLSEGEKKLVTYLPLFSAVAAGCDALEESASLASGTQAGAGIPRFLLLDDAFAKVSEDNHARLFGLLVSLDLDFIATSERLWGTHDTVPELAITEVVRDDTAGVILLEHSHWDGETLTIAS